MCEATCLVECRLADGSVHDEDDEIGGHGGRHLRERDRHTINTDSQSRRHSAVTGHCSIRLKSIEQCAWCCTTHVVPVTVLQSTTAKSQRAAPRLSHLLKQRRLLLVATTGVHDDQVAALALEPLHTLGGYALKRCTLALLFV